MPKGTLALCDLKTIRMGSKDTGDELAQTPILALDENIHLVAFYGWPCHSHLGGQGCVSVPSPLFWGHCYFPPIHPLFFHHLLLLFSLLRYFCELFAIFCKQHKLAPTSCKSQKALYKLTKPIFLCSLLIAIVGHFHSCLLFHPSTLMINNHFFGKNKIKS